MVTWLALVYNVSGPKSYGAAAEVKHGFAWILVRSDAPQPSRFDP